jgi:hypothetical protein
LEQGECRIDQRKKDIEEVYSGSAVPEDYYRYIITFRDGADKPFIEEDVLYMVRNAE